MENTLGLIIFLLLFGLLLTPFALGVWVVSAALLMVARVALAILLIVLVVTVIKKLRA